VTYLEELLVRHLNCGAVTYSVVLSVRDDNGNWVNFAEMTRHSSVSGIDRLVDVGSITITVEKSMDVLSGSVQSVRLDNSDGLFDRPLPAMRSFVVGSTAASFSKSKSSSESVLIGKWCQISVVFSIEGVNYTTDSGFDSNIEYVVGTFVIQDVETDETSNVATWKLAGLQTELIDADAEKIRCGNSWYLNRSAAFLISELVKEKFSRTSSNSLVVGSQVQNRPIVSTIDGSMVSAVLGRPPDYDSGSKSWRDDGFVTRALCYRAGYVYAGCDGEIWKYYPLTDSWSAVDRTTITNVLAGAKVRFMALSETGNDAIYGVAIPDTTTASSKMNKHSAVFFKITSGDSVQMVGAVLEGAFVGAQSVRMGVRMAPFGAPYYAVVIGQYANAYKSGENLSVPFVQSVIIDHSNEFATMSGVFEEVVDKDTTEGDAEIWTQAPDDPVIDLSSTLPFRKTFDRTFYALDVTEQSVASRRLLGCWFSWGQSPMFVLQGVYLHGVYVSHGSLSVGLYSMSMESAALVTVTMATAASTIQKIPVCVGKQDTAISSSFYVGVMVWHEAYDSTTISESWIERYQSGTLALFSTYKPMTGSANDDQYWSFVDILVTSGTTFAILYNRKTQLYALVRNVLVNTFSSMTFIMKTTKVLRNLTYVGESATPEDNWIIWFEQGGRVYKTQNIKTGTAYSIVLGDQDVVVTNEAGMVSNFVWVPQTSASNPTGDMMLFGVSAPQFDPYLYASYPDGKYQMFRISNAFASRVECADFTDMSVWDAVKKIAQALRYVAGVNEYGSFFFVPRVITTSGTVDFVIGEMRDSVTSIVPLSIKKTRGRDSVYNVVKITPGMVVVNAAESVLTLVPREEDPATELGATVDTKVDKTSLGFAPFTIEKKDGLAKTVVAVCVQDAPVLKKYQETANETTKVVQRRRYVERTGVNTLPLFRYAVTYKEIEVYLAREYLSGTTLYVNSVYSMEDLRTSIEIGDIVAVDDPTTGARIYRAITGVNRELTTLTVASDVGVTLPQKTTLLVLKKASTTSNASTGGSAWSDDGITTITASTRVDATTVRLTLSRTDVVSVDTMVESTGQRGLFCRVSKIEPAGTVLIEHTTSTLPSGDLLAYFCPRYFDVSYQIGTSNVFCMFTTPSGEAGVDYTNKFRIGDCLKITSLGTTAEEDSSSTKFAVDVTSIGKNGRREYGEVTNEFMSAGMARELSRLIIEENKDPKYEFDVTVPIAPFLRILNSDGTLCRYDVVSQRLLPMAQNCAVRCTAQEISHDLKNGTTRLKLRATTAY